MMIRKTSGILNISRSRSCVESAVRLMASMPEVTVTKNFSEANSSRSDMSMPKTSLVSDISATDLVDNLLETTESMMDLNGSNIIAFSGGVDSSLVAALVQKTFTSPHSISSSPNDTNTISGNTVAVLGVSPAVPSTQIDLARHVANDVIQIPLREVPTAEGSDPIYIENKGQACLACKTQLYSTLQTVAEHALSSNFSSSSSGISPAKVIMFNGTNKNDTTDPTRLGLIAADNFHVRSPLRHITKDQVRIAAKHLGLPNWNYAASPCLRSRLALGVQATEKHLKMVEEGETFVRNVLGLGLDRNLRVRFLSGGRAGVELDGDLMLNGESKKEGALDIAKEELMNAGFQAFLEEIGFKNGEFVMRKFKTGSVSSAPSAVKS